jgi:hypothetical protein
MGTPQQTHPRVSTGILTKGEREFFRGEKDVEDDDGYRRNARYRARKRIQQIEDDLQVLEAAGEDDLVEEFYNQFSRVQRLEKELEELRSEVETDNVD